MIPQAAKLSAKTRQGTEEREGITFGKRRASESNTVEAEHTLHAPVRVKKVKYRIGGPSSQSTSTVHGTPPVWFNPGPKIDPPESADEGLGSVSTRAARLQEEQTPPMSYSRRPHTHAEIRTVIVHWLTESLRPIDIVKDRGFQSLMRMGGLEHYTPSFETVSRDVRMVFVRTRQRIADMLKKYEGKINLTMDTWTSPSRRAYAAFSAHIEQDGVSKSFPLDFVEVPRVSHTGTELAEAFAKVLQAFGISEKVLSVTCDNASNKHEMVYALAQRVPAFGGAGRAGCFLHIVNLVAKSLIRQFEMEWEDAEAAPTVSEVKKLEELDNLTEDIERLEYDEGEVQHDNEEGWIDEVTLLSKDECAKLLTMILPVKSALKKIRILAFKLNRSTTLLLPTALLLATWKTILMELDLPTTFMPCDVATRWSSTYDLIRYALDHRRAVEEITRRIDLGLAAVRLVDSEWELLQQLCDILKVLKDATLYFSRPMSSVTMVLPALKHIDNVLAGKSRKDLVPPIRAALGTARKTLDRFSQFTCDSRVYFIAMLLHPRYKTAFFKSAEWETHIMSTVEQLVENEFEFFYHKGMDEQPPGDADSEDSDHEETDTEPSNLFDKLATLSRRKTADTRSELERYLSSDVEHVSDAIAWWHARRAAYPQLSRMALDYLTIPATLCDVQKVFSRARGLLSHGHISLVSPSTRALLCLGCWSELDLVACADLEYVSTLPDVVGQEDELEEGCDAIEK